MRLVDPSRGRVSLVVLLENHLEDLEAEAVGVGVAVIAVAIVGWRAQLVFDNK